MKLIIIKAHCFIALAGNIKLSQSIQQLVNRLF